MQINNTLCTIGCLLNDVTSILSGDNTNITSVEASTDA